MNEKEKYVLNKYDITEDGRIYSSYTNKFLRFREDKDGYYDVALVYNDEGKRMPFRVHRLIALKYVNNPNNSPQVNHMDLNKQNNSIDNLEWVTIAENTQHGYDNSAYAHINKVKVTESNGNIHIFPSTSHAARYYYYANPTTIQAILECRSNNPIPTGRRKGLFFEYTNEGVTTIERNPIIVNGV